MILEVRTATHADPPLQRAARRSPTSILAAGVLCIAGFLYWLTEGALYQSYQSHQLDQIVSDPSLTDDDWVPGVFPFHVGKPDDGEARTSLTESRNPASTKQMSLDTDLIVSIW
jgi:hypothetical protein